MPHPVRRPVQPLQQERLFQQQQHGVVHAPQHEVPAGPVPQTRQKPHDSDIQQLPPQSLPVAAQRDVDVLTEPCGQADVPPPPELRHGAGLIGIVEVLQKPEAEQPAQADGHIGIAGEVEIDLERKCQRPQPRRDHGGRGHGRDLLPHGTHLVGQQHLLAQADDEPLHTGAGPCQRLAVPVLQIGGHRLVLDDRPRDELREQRHIGAEIDDVPLGRHQSPVHVDGIAHGLERVERDADGQQQPQRGDSCTQQTVEIGDGEIRILEESQNAQVAHHGHHQHRLGALGLPHSAEVSDGQAVAVVEHRGEQHDEDIFWLAPAVEQQAEHQQQRVAQLSGADEVQDAHQRQKRQQERGTAENHVSAPLLDS